MTAKHVFFSKTFEKITKTVPQFAKISDKGTRKFLSLRVALDGRPTGTPKVDDRCSAALGHLDTKSLRRLALSDMIYLAAKSYPF